MLLIRKINYLRDSTTVINIINNSFKETLMIQNPSFKKYSKKIVKNKFLLKMIEKLHFIISKFNETFILTDNRKIIGSITIQKERIFNNTNWLLCNAVFDKKYKNINLSTAVKFRKLLNTAINHAKKLKAKNIIAEIRSDNPVPYRFCKMLGFKYLNNKAKYYIIKRKSNLKKFFHTNLKNKTNTHLRRNISIFRYTKKIKYRIKGFDYQSYSIFKENRSIGVIKLKISRTNGIFLISISIHPKYKVKYVINIIRLALLFLYNNFPNFNIIFIEFLDSDSFLIKALNSLGFKKSFKIIRLIKSLM